MGGNHKRGVCRLQAVGQRLPIVLLQDQTEMGHGYQVLADMACQRGFEGFAQMQRDLVREKVKVHPRVGGATFGATEDAAVKAAGFVEVGDVKCEME
jgi:hypothetical protein